MPIKKTPGSIFADTGEQYLNSVSRTSGRDARYSDGARSLHSVTINLFYM